MSHVFIKDIKPGMQVNDIYLATQPVLRHTTKGDLYIAMYLSDKTGKVNSRMWQATEQIYSQIPGEGFVQIRGKSELYQNALQVVINDILVVSPDKVSIADYMPRTLKDIDQMYEDLKRIIGSIKNPFLHALTQEFLVDKDLMREFCRAPAAMQMHHNYIGGLLEHTHNMLNVAEVIIPFYPKIQRDLVIAAIFLHDIAKTSEFSYKTAISYTNAGQLLGHIVMGTELVNEKADALTARGTTVDQDILDNLLHIIISHHGSYEFGSPKLPATAEAFMVNYIDDLDAKMNQVAEIIENEPGEADWTAYQKPLETKLYRKKVIQ